jgi:hypothetical protein
VRLVIAEDAVLTRLAQARDGEVQPYLLPHHLAAADRLERLIRRSNLAPRVTMSYDAVSPRERGRSGANTAAELTDSAAAARQYLNRLAAMIPSDCWGVLFDVCALGKGLQAVETERRWPRRSAKLVLRIGLDQLASLFGLAPHQAGSAGSQTRSWTEKRLPLIAEDLPS